MINSFPLPQALGPEKSVLSSVMKERHLLDEAGLVAEMFHCPGHRPLFEAMAAAPELELVSFIEGLHQAGKLDSIGGPGAISEIYTYAPNNAHFVGPVAILRDRMARRMAIAACGRAIERAHDCADEDFLDGLASPVTAVFDAAAAARPPKDTKAIAREFIAAFERRVAGDELSMGIPFGISEVDRYLRGMHPGHMGIISGRSGGGKSTLATQVAGNLAADGIPTLYLPLERGDMSVFERTVIQQAGVHHGVVKDPRGHAQMDGRNGPTKDELRGIRDAVQTLVPTLHVRKPDNRRLATIVAEIRRHHRLHGVRVAFVDQIGLIRGERIRGDSGEAELRGVSNTLQELAHELAMTVIVLSQVNNEGETKNARAVEEDADWHLSIVQEMDRKKENFGEHLHVLLAKDSHNGHGGERLPLVLNRDNLRFVHGFPRKAEAEEPKRKGRWG